MRCDGNRSRTKIVREEERWRFVKDSRTASENETVPDRIGNSPWRVFTESYPDGQLLIDVVDRNIDTVCELQGEYETLATAALIAAAPELLAALKRALLVIRALHGLGLPSQAEPEIWALYLQSPEVQAIEAVISKATGESEATGAVDPVDPTSHGRSTRV